MATIYDLDILQKQLAERDETIRKQQEIIDNQSSVMPTGRFIQLRTLQDADAKMVEYSKIIDRQRNALQVLLNAIWIHINAPDDNGIQLQDAYRLISSASTMTGTTEE